VAAAFDLAVSFAGHGLSLAGRMIFVDDGIGGRLLSRLRCIVAKLW